VTGARRLAYDALRRIDQHGAYANVVLPAMLARSELDQRDRGFVTELVYGTTRMRRACDFAVDRFVQKEPSADIRTLLRLGAYQLLFAGVAPHAAVHDTVALASGRSRSFVNAVLRRVAAIPPAWPDDATRLSYPDWIVDRLIAELGPTDAFGALERMNAPPPVTVRADGYVQDSASQWVADLVGATNDERVADLCAAPGGKATRMAGAGAVVVAADLRPGRAALIGQNAARTKVAHVHVVVADARTPPFPPASFDRVLLDAPCSGLGALRRRPDARWRIQPGDIYELAALQRGLLAAAKTLVRPGGWLVYSVCTLTAAESIDHDVVAWPVEPPPAPWRPYGRGGRLLPQDADTDGMIVLRYRRPA
jgi:16S rRNA (cytosine967-C5)-methyltransferase